MLNIIGDIATHICHRLFLEMSRPFVLYDYVSRHDQAWASPLFLEAPD